MEDPLQMHQHNNCRTERLTQLATVDYATGGLARVTNQLYACMPLILLHYNEPSANGNKANDIYPPPLVMIMIMQSLSLFICTTKQVLPLY